MGAALQLKTPLAIETHREKPRPQLKLVVGGAFLQKDPSPGAVGIPVSVVNSYGYAANNPGRFRDPSGRSWFGKAFNAAMDVSSFATLGIAGAAALMLTGNKQLERQIMISVWFAGATGGAGFAAGAAVGGGFAGAAVGAGAGGAAGGVFNSVTGRGSFWSGVLQGAVAGGLAGYSAGSTASVGTSSGGSSASYEGTSTPKPYGAPFEDPGPYGVGADPTAECTGGVGPGCNMIDTPYQYWEELHVPWPSSNLPLEWNVEMIRVIGI